MKKVILVSRIPYILTWWFALVSLASCTKLGNNPESGIGITRIDPVSARFGTPDTIFGRGFGITPGTNTVTINGHDSQVLWNSADHLIILIPRGAGTGNIRVSTGGLQAAGPVFHYIYTVMVSTLAGNGQPGFINGNGPGARFLYPSGLAVDSAGNVYVADYGNYCIRKITPDGIVTTYAGNGIRGHRDGVADSAEFNSPGRLALDDQGNLFVTDFVYVRKITPGGRVTTVAGDGNYGYRDGPDSQAEFNFPFGIAVDNADNIYLADIGNNNIRKIPVTGNTQTLAGSIQGFADGQGTSAQFNFPSGLILSGGWLFIADADNSRIRQMSISGMVSTIAGNGNFGSVDGPSETAEFAFPSGLAADSAGDLFECGQDNRIRMISISRDQVTPVAGNGQAGLVDGDAGSAEFYQPLDLAFDRQGNLYVADHLNQCIRKISFE